MRTKFGSHYADWRDEHGKRHMKAFPTAKAARTFTATMKRKVATKKGQTPRALPSSSKRSLRATKKETRENKPATASAKP